MKIILTNGQAALIDDDFAYLARWKWQAIVKPHGSYAMRTTTVNGKKTAIAMHRLIAGAIGDPRYVDHLNGDTLDNRKENLRLVDAITNARNVSPVTKANKTSPYRGVALIPSSGRYRATIRAEGKTHSLGVYATAAEANAARLHAEKRLWGLEPRRAQAFAGVQEIVPQTRPDWSDEEKRFLLENYDKGAAWIAEKLGRTKKAVYGMKSSINAGIDGKRSSSTC